MSSFSFRAIAAVAAIAAALPLGSALAQTAAPAAPQPAPVAPVPSPVVVYSLQAVVAGSAAGRDMATKLQAIETALTTELETEARAIVEERQRLGQTPAAQLQTAAVQQADAANQRRAQAFDVARQRAEYDLRATNERALRLFVQALQPVMIATVERRNALVVLEAGNVNYAVPGVDITRDLITALDASVSTINVVRVRVQTEEEAAAAAASGTPPAATPAGTPAATATPAGQPLPRRPTPVPVPR
jgi:Skp family chaperone for outer membrane proteins